jgi:hypothetical protein
MCTELQARLDRLRSQLAEIEVGGVLPNERDRYNVVQNRIREVEVLLRRQGCPSPTGGTGQTPEPIRLEEQVIGVNPPHATRLEELVIESQIRRQEPMQVRVGVSVVDPGIDAPQQIGELISRFTGAIGRFWRNYRDGLLNFEGRMNSASDEDAGALPRQAAAQQLQAALKGVAKRAFDTALSQVGTSLGGPWGGIISAAKEAIEAWANRSEHVATAAGRVRVADYIERIRNGIDAQETTMISEIERMKSQVRQQFAELASGDVERGRPTPEGVITGESARTLNALRADVEAFERAIPQSSYFQQQFATGLANTPGLSANVSQGGRPSGTLYFNLKISFNPARPESWSITDKDEAWRLVTNAPDPDRVATSMSRSMAAEHKKPWQIELPKMVRMRIKVEGSGESPLQEGNIRFERDPAQYEVRSLSGEQRLREAWSNVRIRNEVLNVTNLVGSSQ